MLFLEEDSSSDHIREMAQYFKAELNEGNDASIITMDNDMGKGFISSFRLFSGLAVWVYNLSFGSDFKVDLGLSEGGPYYFCYNVKGHFLHRFGGEKDFMNILQNQNMIVKGIPDESAQLVFPADTKLEIAVVTVEMPLLGALDIRNAKRIHSGIQNIFQKIPSDRVYRHLGPIDGETGKYASVVCENNRVDFVGGLQTEGAVLNMLASQLQSYSNYTTGPIAAPNLSKPELSKITSLGSYVIGHLDTKLTVQEVSKTFGVSPKKLQLGVQHLYGDTVGHYILNIRLGHARDLFITTDLNVSQVCNAIGLSSYSYFGKVFKGRYGVSPSLFRKKILGKG